MEKFKIAGINKYYYYKKLDNGLDVYLFPDRHSKHYYLTFSTIFGGKVTDFKKKSETSFHHVPPGTAHFLEHQLFERSEGKSVYDYFNQQGASANAYTSGDLTCYEVIGTTNIYKNLIYLINYVQSPCFTTASVNKEKGIIIEEINRGQDDINRQLLLSINSSLFHHDNIRIPNAGSEEDVKKMTIAELQLSYDYFYHPSNMQIIIAGNFNVKKTMAMIEKNQNNKKFSAPEKIIIKEEKEEDTVLIEHSEKKMNMETPHFIIAYKIPLSHFKSLKLKNYQILYYLSLIMKMNFKSTSLISQQLFDQQLVLSGLGTLSYVTKHHAIIGVRNVTKFPEKVIDIIRDAMQHLTAEKSNYQRIKKVLLSNYISDFDYVDSIVDNMIEDILLMGKPYNDFLNYVKQDDYDNVCQVISKIDLHNCSTVIIRPKKDNN